MSDGTTGNGLCVFNGVDAETGDYLLARRPVAEVQSAFDDGGSRFSGRGARFGVDLGDLGSAGWAVVFAPGTDQGVRDALGLLLRRRREQAEARRGGLYRELWGEDGYRTGETADDFLARHGAGPGVADPKVFPYYVLLVGDPAAIPFEVQFDLDVQYGVGRLAFDTADEYRRYAESVVAVEEGERLRERRLALWGPANAGDGATSLSCRQLVGGLAAALTNGEAEDGDDSADARADWQVTAFQEAEATKERLLSLLGGPETPALLFTASHGLGFSRGHPRQREAQGALICQDWPGPGSGPISPGQCVSAADLGEGAEVRGLVSFHFACFGGGTPEQDAFAHQAGWLPRALTATPFVARLPQRLAGHPGGGALAVVGHVERAWSFSFEWRQLSDQIGAFEAALETLMAGYPVGAAMEAFGQKSGEVATRLVSLIGRKERGLGFDPAELLMLWTAHADARAYAVFGDPAARLPVAAAAPNTPAVEA
jgi:hypothetical protein